MPTFGEVIENLRRSTVQVRTNRNSSGSGVIWSEDGQIATNAHVVDGAGLSGAVEVELWDGYRMPARIVKSDRRRDVAVLQVEASGLQAATMGDSNALRVGELVVAVGNPFGFTGAASTGVVHRLSDSWVVSQLRLGPGNSGGPLANASGEVVGMNTMIAGGLAFAIPSQSVAQPLSTASKLERTLGVVVRSMRAGLIVLEVVPGSPADRASLLQGDILVGARSLGGILEIQFRRGASQNLRMVAIRIAASVRAA